MKAGTWGPWGVFKEPLRPGSPEKWRGQQPRPEGGQDESGLDGEGAREPWRGFEQERDGIDLGPRVPAPPGPSRKALPSPAPPFQSFCTFKKYCCKISISAIINMQKCKLGVIKPQPLEDISAVMDSFVSEVWCDCCPGRGQGVWVWGCPAPCPPSALLVAPTVPQLSAFPRVWPKGLIEEAVGRVSQANFAV